MEVRIEYPSAFKTPPKLVSNAEGEAVEVILTYEDYQRLLELLEDAYDAALAESLKDEEYTSWEEFKAELDIEQCGGIDWMSYTIEISNAAKREFRRLSREVRRSRRSVFSGTDAYGD